MRKKPNTHRAQVKYGFTREQQKTYPVTLQCRVMQVSTSAYYAWCNSPPYENKTHQYQQLVDSVRQLFTDNKQCFGSRRLADRLQKQGFAVGRFKTRRIMRELKLKVSYPQRFKVTTDSNHSEAIFPTRLDRQFKVAQPNQVWTMDITYVWMLQGWLYVAIVIDLFSRQVVGSAIDDHMRTSLCVKALQMAFYPQGTSGAVNRRLDCFTRTAAEPAYQPGISATPGGDTYGAEHEPER